MDYIINPTWFYLLQVCEGIRSVVLFFAIIISIATLVCIIVWGVNKWIYHEFPSISSDEEKTFRSLEKTGKPAIIIAAALWILFVIVPSQNTMISMMVAKFATYDNAQWTVDTVKAAVDYIVQAIQQIG